MRKRASLTKITPSKDGKAVGNSNRGQVAVAIVDKVPEAPRQVDRVKMRMMRNGPLAKKTKKSCPIRRREKRETSRDSQTKRNGKSRVLRMTTKVAVRLEDAGLEESKPLVVAKDNVASPTRVAKTNASLHHST